MTPQDARLVAALTVLRDQLAPVVDELLADELTEQERAELARALRTVAQDLSPIAVVEGTGQSYPAHATG